MKRRRTFTQAHVAFRATELWLATLALGSATVPADERPRMTAATGAHGFVTVYTADAGASALLAGACDAFVRDLAAWLGRPPLRQPVALVFHRLGAEEEGDESRVLDTALPAAVYHVRRPVPRSVVLRDLVILDTMARKRAVRDRARAADAPDWLTLGLAAVVHPTAAPDSDRLVARAIRRSGRVPSLDRVLAARSDLEGPPVVQGLGSLLVRSLSESPAGRAGLVRLLDRPRAADESPVTWLGSGFPPPSPSPAYLRRWWALACIRTSQRFLGGRSDSPEIASELHEALNPVVRTLPDAAGRALRVAVRDLPLHRDEPWFRRAVAEAGARLDRVVLLAPGDLRPPLHRYREAVRLLGAGRIAGFEAAFQEAEADWHNALARREAVTDYLDLYDKSAAETERVDIDTLLDALIDAAAVGPDRPSKISRYLDSIEAQLKDAAKDAPP